jgi:uncharacterized protein
MSSLIDVNRLVNCNVYMNGDSMLGRCEEAKVPGIKHVMAEYKALGMVAKLDMWAGLDKMKADFKWASFYPSVLVTIANPFVPVVLQVRGSLQNWNDSGMIAETPLVVHLKGLFEEHAFGDYKMISPAEFPSKFNATYVKCVHDGIELYELDAMSNILKVGGVDLLATYRANIGA